MTPEPGKEPLFNSWTDEEIMCLVSWVLVTSRDQWNLVMDPAVVRRVFNAYASSRLAVAADA